MNSLNRTASVQGIVFNFESFSNQRFL